MLKTVSHIVKEYTNNRYHPWPVAWLQLECGHSAKAVLFEEKDSAHDDFNHRVLPGDQVECERCDWQVRNLAELRAEGAARYSHSRFRHNDSRGFGPGSLYVYERDRTSPTGCKLWLTLDDTPEAAEALRQAGSSPLSPTEGR